MCGGGVELRDSGSFISNAVLSEAIATGGDININADWVSVTNGAQIFAGTFGRGDSGNINLNVNNAVSFDGVANNGNSSGALNLVQPGATGNAGNININARSLSLTGGAILQGDTEGNGNGGNVNINVTNSVVFDGIGSPPDSDFVFSGAYSRVADANAVGNAGNINITAGSVSITNGAVFSTITRGEGNAGDVNINASNSIVFEGQGPFEESRQFSQSSGIFTNVKSTGLGSAGSVNLSSNSLFLRNGAAIFATTRGTGNGGLFANTAENSTGAGGILTLSTNNLIVEDGAEINVSASGLGAAGNLEIFAPSITFNNGSLAAETRAGEFGNIRIETGNLQLRQNSSITTNATGLATGGNIVINADTLVAGENSDITANAVASFGGRVNINTQGILRNLDSDITATSELGPEFSGVVQINSEVNLASGLFELPEETVDAASLIDTRCRPGNEDRSEYINAGRGGTPPNPREPLNNSSGWVDNRYSATSQQTYTPNPNSEELVEARGWIVNAKGNIELVANPELFVLTNSGFVPVRCARGSTINN